MYKTCIRGCLCWHRSRSWGSASVTISRLSLFRLMIGAIGTSFVITQYHTSIMFAHVAWEQPTPAAAGWGNLGGGVTQIVMPLVFAVCSLRCSALGRRLAGGSRCSLRGLSVYWLAWRTIFFTQDAPEGNFRELARGWEAAADEEIGR